MIFITTQAFNSCEKNIDADIKGKWQIVKLRVGGTIYDYNSLDYQLTFESDSSVVLKLDVNTCLTNYTLKNNNEIEFQHFGCTKICCDNNLSIILLPEFNNVKTVVADDEDMELRGENTIYLKRLNY
jgi:hypothetical protein